MINQFIKQHKDGLPDDDAQEGLSILKQQLKNNTNSYLEKENAKLLEKVEELLFEKTEENDIRPVLFLGDDNFTLLANAIIAAQPQTEKVLWYELIGKAQKATGSKPSKKYIAESKEIINNLGT